MPRWLRAQHAAAAALFCYSPKRISILSEGMAAEVHVEMCVGVCGVCGKVAARAAVPVAAALALVLLAAAALADVLATAAATCCRCPGWLQGFPAQVCSCHLDHVLFS